MNKIFLKIVVLCMSVVTCLQVSFGQTVNDSAAINHTVAGFDKSIGYQSRLYNGTEYPPVNPLFTGNAFFQNNDKWSTGKVKYDGIVYEDIPLLYDLYGDLVVTLLYNKFSRYSLVSDKVQEFYLADHHFVRINADTTGINTIIKTGFYDELYAGKIKLYARRTKTLQTSSTGETKIETYYLPKTEYYLKKGTAYYGYGSQGSLFSLLADHKKDLQQYLKSKQVRFKDNPEQAMALVAAYYDHLTN